MNHDNFICPKTKRKIFAKSIYKIEDKNAEESILMINRNCPYVSKCKNCYGTICCNRRKLKSKKGASKIEKNIYTDTYTDNGNDILNFLNATIFIEEIEILDVLNSTSNNNISVNGWAYADRSNTWKTDCIKCRRESKEKNELTPCEKATKNYEDAGINLKYASDEQIVNHELPEECRCTAPQKICYLY